MQTDIRGLKEGQVRLEDRQLELEGDVKDIRPDIKQIEFNVNSIKNELPYIGENIKRIDSRLLKQEQETFLLKRVSE